MSGVETLTANMLWSSLIKWAAPLEQTLFCWREAIALLGEESPLWKPRGCQDTACLSRAGFALAQCFARHGDRWNPWCCNFWRWRQFHSNRKLLRFMWPLWRFCVMRNTMRCSKQSDDAAFHELSLINTLGAKRCSAPRYQMTHNYWLRGHGKGRRLYHGSVRNAVSSFGSWGDESYKSQCHLAAFKQVLPGSGYRIFAAQAGHCLTLDPWLDPSEQFYTSEKSIPLLCNFLTLRNIWDLIKLTYWDISSWFVNVHMFYYFL